ncbi:MAG: sigma-70 family RNA polymerase sigma factor [bacterium]|nr:sigma-70 family RNA polymerase sigma factor [bacterium]
MHASPEYGPAPEFQRTLAAARSGEPAALEALFERFYPPVRNMVHGTLSGDLRVQRPWLTALFSTGDIVQDVFKSVLGDLDAFKGENEHAFVGYLAMVIRNRLLDAIRFHEAARRDRRRIGASTEDVEVEHDTRTPSARAASAEQVALFCGVVASFSPREQLLLRERIENDAPYAELAERFGYPSADAARKAFYTAQARLVTRLRNAGMRSPEAGE